VRSKIKGKGECEVIKSVKMKNKVLIILAVMSAAIAVIMVGGGWYVSNSIRDEVLVPKHGVRPLDLEVAHLIENQITLRVSPRTKKDDWRKDGIWGLRWNGGYAQVGQILDIDDQQVVRMFFPLMGNLKQGHMVRLDALVFPDDPQKSFGLLTQEVVFSSPLGKFHAWFIEGLSSTWAIFVHGKRDHPPQQPLHAFPILPVISRLGVPCLVITYRNDLGVPKNPDGYHWFGLTEWEDLEGAANYAFGHGAERLILVGYSMGGAIVMNFLYQSPLAKEVQCIILDSPMLDLNATIVFRGYRLAIPKFLTEIGKFIAGMRFEIDWQALDYLRRANELSAPILLFHGDADMIVPVETSNSLAKARPDIVSYHRVSGATHIRSWNMNPVKYETAARDFLRNLLR
jgi:pimeloyl-ACP methyl ester carboxylesterase